MKILYHHRTQMGDAQGVHIREIIKGFKKNGNEVKIFSLVKDGSGDAEERKISKSKKFWNIISSLVPKFVYELMELAYNAYGYFKLRSYIKKYKPDFIYERYAMFNFCGVLAAKHKKIPIFVEVNAPLYYEKIKYDKLIFKSVPRKIENWICNNTTKTITVTTAMKNILVKQGCNADNIVVMLNGINQDEFNVKIERESIRKKYSISDKDIVVGVVGWFRQWHGLDFLIKTSYEKNCFKEQNIHFLFVGDGPAVPEAKKMAQKLDLDSKITFTGAVGRQDIPKYLAAIDIALQPRVTEYACPMKIIEYMAMGKAIIAPDQPNIQEILTHGEDALLFKPENQEDFFSKVNELISDDMLRQKLANKAVETVKDKQFYWEENCQKVVDLYKANQV